MVLSNYLRLLGYEARSHSGSCSDVDLNKLTVAAGLGEVIESPSGPVISNPYTGTRFAVGAITTLFEMHPDQPLKPRQQQGVKERMDSHGPGWWVGKGHAKNALNAEPYRKRRFVDGAFPFERSKRVEKPTTFMDEARIPRVPKRPDIFSRAIFG